MSERGTMPYQASGHEPASDLAAYALGVLDSDDRMRLEAHLATCVICRAELLRYETVVGDLGGAVTPVPPRPELRERVLAGIRSDAPAAPSLLRRQVPAIWLGVAAAVAVIALAVLGAMLFQTREALDEARYAERAIADYLKDGGTLSALAPPAGAPDAAAPGHGSLIVAPDQSGAMLVVYDLPPTSDDRTYRAWAERGSERVDLGELRVNEDGVGWLYLYGPEPMSTYETIGMSLFSGDDPDGETFLVAPVE